MEPIGKLEFRCESLPNLTLKLHPVLAQRGLVEVELRVTLNISKRMKKHLPASNIEKGKDFYVYALRKRIFDFNLIPEVYEELLTKAMISCREAKKIVIDEEIDKLTKKL